MSHEHGHSTGIPNLDKVLTGILAGDNIVWKVDSVEDYATLVAPFAEHACRSGRKVIYFRFANHATLLSEEDGAEVYELDPEDGFETFISHIHAVIESVGRGAYYVFDCLSDLAITWHSDTMLGNFFMLTCPYLFDMETVAYFCIYRGHHAYYALTPISNTTQLFLEVYRHQKIIYIRPLKIQHRHSESMSMLHAWQGDEITPVTSSARIAEILTPARWSELHADRRPGFWEKSFLEAQEAVDMLKQGKCTADEADVIFQRLVRMVISRDDRIIKLVSRHLTLEDILDVRRRMIGTGLIGGKAVGMLLSRAILKQSLPRFNQLLEAHDSFFIGSDVFHTFLVRNNIWWIRQNQRHPEKFLEGAERARQRILTGTFPEQTIKQLEEMLDYFGKSPFIVRSSSLLEDNFGNAFAGKYDSVFCANQGPRSQRRDDFLAAVRTIYASTMSERALRYRSRRGMLDQDEQMALLVMRVSGNLYGHYFYPPVAGVGFSYNPYVWNPEIDPSAGVARLVFGLGTRAVDRLDDDYTRLVALNAPDRRPEHGVEEARHYAQRLVDYIDLNTNHLSTGHFLDVIKDIGDMPLELFVSSDRSVRDRNGAPVRFPSFAKLLSESNLVEDLKAMLAVLHKAYDYPVDIEFTVNFEQNGAYRINLVQCRPLQVQGSEHLEIPTVNVPADDKILVAHGSVVGQSRIVDIEHMIYIDQENYGSLPVADRYAVARTVGDINRQLPRNDSIVNMLIGPGRWGTNSPELGVPVAFSDISNMSVLCEVVAMRKDLVPDVSLGTHFLNELVEMEMLYLAIFPERKDCLLKTDFFKNTPNHLLELLPGSEKWVETIKIIKFGPDNTHRMKLVADALQQNAICYIER